MRIPDSPDIQSIIKTQTHETMNTEQSKQFNLGGKLYSCDQPLIMGIVNITPDSFFEGSRVQSEKEIADQIEKHLSEGADILDLGAYSSRPGATHISETEEIERLQSALPIIKSIAPNTPISIDTFRSSVVSAMFDQFGPFIVNDISGGHQDSSMYETVAKYKLPYIGMHMRGTPKTMQSLTDYDSLTNDIIRYFTKMIDELQKIGVGDIIIDPGFGFSKTLEQNYSLLSELDRFQVLNKPILVGVSRKSMIYKLLEVDPADALNGTTSLNTIALLKGANILRVHDVAPAKEVIRLTKALN